MAITQAPELVEGKFDDKLQILSRQEDAVSLSGSVVSTEPYHRQTRSEWEHLKIPHITGSSWYLSPVAF